MLKALALFALAAFISASAAEAQQNSSQRPQQGAQPEQRATSMDARRQACCNQMHGRWEVNSGTSGGTCYGINQRRSQEFMSCVNR